MILGSLQCWDHDGQTQVDQLKGLTQGKQLIVIRKLIGRLCWFFLAGWSKIRLPNIWV